MRQILSKLKSFEKAKVSQFYDLLPLPCALINSLQNIVYVNKALCQLTDYSESKLIGKHWSSLFADAEQHDKNSFQRLLNQQRTLTQHKRKLLTRNHTALEGLLEISALNDTSDQINLILITFQVAPNPGIGATMRLLQNAIDNQPYGLVIATESQQIIYANQSFCEQTGFDLGDVLGKNSSLIHPPKTLKQLVINGEIWQGCHNLTKKDGSQHWVRETITPLINRDDQCSHYLINIDPFVSESTSTNTSRAIPNHQDTLTGLLNRDGLEQLINALILDFEPLRDRHTLCRIDIDQFRVINGSCGHLGGDALLRQISQIIEQETTSSDIIGRYGADEFILLLCHCSPNAAVTRLEKIRSLVQQRSLIWNNQRYPVSISIGVVPMTEKPNSFTELLLHADSACHTAKTRGRNRITVYQTENTLDYKPEDDLFWILAINRALEDDHFKLFAQPIAKPTVQPEDVPHYEVLIRYKDEQGELHQPNQFMPTAESHGLTPKIDRWVISHVLQWMKNVLTQGKDLPFLSINLSGHSLSQENLIEFIIENIRSNDIPAENLCFEITETAAILNLEIANQFIDKLQQLGCSISLDDFGSGLSSFAYLKNLSIDYLKIDGMFVKNLRYDPIDLSMVRSITEIGHVMGKKIVAEWVEDEQTAQILEELDVDYIQGFWVGKPESLEKIIDQLPVNGDLLLN